MSKRKDKQERKIEATKEEQLRQKLVTETGYSKAVIRDARTIGLSEAQIMSVTNEEALRSLVTNVDPKLLADMPPRELQEATKTRTPPEPVPMEKKNQSFSIQVSPMIAKTQMRGDHEQRELDHFVNRQGIRNIVRVISTREYESNEFSKYDTTFRIIYKEPK